MAGMYSPGPGRTCPGGGASMFFPGRRPPSLYTVTQSQLLVVHCYFTDFLVFEEVSLLLVEVGWRRKVFHLLKRT